MRSRHVSLHGRRDGADHLFSGLLAGPENVLIVALEQPDNKPYAGKRLAEIAAMRKVDWPGRGHGRRVDTIHFMMSEDNVRLGLKQPWIKIGTDSSAIDPVHATNLAHPRSYSAFPRILGQYVRDEHLLPTIEDCCRPASLRILSSSTRPR